MKPSIFMMFFLVFLFSCEKNEQKTVNSDKIIVETPQYVKDITDKKKSDSLLSEAINKGNEKAYNDIAGSYILAEKYDKLLYYSLIMANKHNSAEAYYHVFLILTKDDFDSLDSKTQYLALFFLVKSNELGYESAKYSINEILKNEKTHPSSFYLTKYYK